MSDNEDLLGDDLGDHSLADYNLGNEEEEQLLADDYEMGASQNVPTSVGPYRDSADMGLPEYPAHNISYNQPMQYHTNPGDTECIVPNIAVEVPNTPIPDHSTYAPYEPPPYEADHGVVPPAIPASPIESPQIVPSEMTGPVANGERERFVSERPPGAQRMPQVRNIPDSLDKVYVPRGPYNARGRNTWRNPQFRHNNHPYRRNNMHRGNFAPRPSFPPPQIRPALPQIRLDIQPEPRPVRPDHPGPQIRPEILEPRPEPPEIRPDIGPGRLEIRPELPPGIRPEPVEMRPEIHNLPVRPDLGMPMRPELRPEGPPDLNQLPPQISPERPMMPPEMFRMDNPPPFQRFPFRPNLEERPYLPRAFEPRPMFYQPQYNPRFGPPMREPSHLPQVTIRQEPEVRMLPVLPPILPPGGLAGKKVLINPHFKGNFQPPVEGLPTYIPTRIHKSPPPSPPRDLLFAGPIKDIDDAAERFIAEQRNALARAASRKFARRSPQRYIENTTIEIENDLARAPPRRSEDEELLRRQEEFINANRAGLRRRMRSPSPARRSPSPARRSPERRPELRPELRPEHRAPPSDEDTEYRRRLREQESLRERVLRAKEVRRRKNAVLLQKQIQEREREKDDKDTQAKLEEPERKPEPKIEPKPEPTPVPKKEVKEDIKPSSTLPEVPRPDTTRKSPEKPVKKEVERERSPHREEAEVNSTCEGLTPPRSQAPLTPPLPRRTESDDELDLILDDIDGILSDDDDDARFKSKPQPVETPKPQAKPQVDLRSKLPPKAAEVKKPPRQKITFSDSKEREKDREDKKKKEKSPVRRTIVTSSTKAKSEVLERKTETEREKDKKADTDSKPFSNRRVILQRKVTADVKKSVFTRVETDPSKPNPGIFSRAVRTAIGSDSSRIVIKKHEPKVEYESESDDEDRLLEDDEGSVARVANLPPGITDTRLRTLAGEYVQSLELDKEERTARIAFKTPHAAESFKRKFNNKMVAASRLSVTLS